MLETSISGFTMTVDLHGCTVIEAKRELNAVLKKCPAIIRELEVIHGYSQGQALLNFVRKGFSHPRIERRIITMNRGVTILLLKPLK